MHFFVLALTSHLSFFPTLLRWPSSLPTSCPSPLYLCLLCRGCFGDIPGTAVFISAFNNEWKDTIRQSLQNHVAHNAQGQDSGCCQRGWWLAQTSVCACLCLCAPGVHTKGQTWPLVKDSQRKIYQNVGRGKDKELCDSCTSFIVNIFIRTRKKTLDNTISSQYSLLCLQ